MQKTKLGISVGLLGAIIYFSGLFGGYIITILVAGYVLLFVENAWLKKAAVKSVVIMVMFSLLSAVLYLLPNVIELINGVANIFGGTFYVNVISNIVAAIDDVLVIVEKLLFIVLGIKALNQGIVSISFIDRLIDKHMD